jgi:hypothetical protein
MKVNLLLADHGDAVGGKLYIHGGGWNVTGPQLAPFAIAMLIEVPWDQTNTKHRVLLELLDADGIEVEVASSPSWSRIATSRTARHRNESVCVKSPGSSHTTAMKRH